MGNTFTMNTVNILDNTRKNEKVATKYKTKCNNVYSSVNIDEDINTDKAKSNDTTSTSESKTKSIRKKISLTIDTNV